MVETVETVETVEMVGLLELDLELLKEPRTGTGMRMGARRTGMFHGTTGSSGGIPTRNGVSSRDGRGGRTGSSVGSMFQCRLAFGFLSLGVLSLTHTLSGL